MKTMRFRLIITLLVIVALSTVLAVMISFVIGQLVLGDDVFMQEVTFTGMAVKEVITVILIVSLTALFIGLNAKRIVAPVEKLTEETKQIAKGDFNTEIEVSGRKDEIGVLEKNFSVMVRELKSIEYMRKDFVAIISHDLKTPLSIIEGYAGVLEEDNLPEGERKQCAATIKKETQRLINMTSNMLRISKLSSQNIQTVRNEFRLGEQIRQAVVLLEPKWNEKEIRFHIDLQEVDYTGDEELLSQVWFNLIDNAIKFSHHGGTIKIQMGIDQKNIQIKITDNGIGIDKQTLKHIFDQFYQGETSRGGEGSGLGLSIVKRIVELHDGKIIAKSQSGTGTSFLVTLPATE